MYKLCNMCFYRLQPVNSETQSVTSRPPRTSPHPGRASAPVLQTGRLVTGGLGQVSPHTPGVVTRQAETHSSYPPSVPCYRVSQQLTKTLWSHVVIWNKILKSLILQQIWPNNCIKVQSYCWGSTRHRSRDSSSPGNSLPGQIEPPSQNKQRLYEILYDISNKTETNRELQSW